MGSILLLLDSIAQQALVSPDIPKIANTWDASVVAADSTNKARSGSAPHEFGLLLDLACALAADLGGQVRVLSVIEAAANESLSMSALAAQHRRQQIATWIRNTASDISQRLASVGCETETTDPEDIEARRSGATSQRLPDMQPVVSVAAAGGYWREVADAVQRHDGHVLIAGWGAAGVTTNAEILLRQNIPCDLVMVRPAPCASRNDTKDGAGQVAHDLVRARVLVPARGGPHARLAVHTAAALVAHRSAELVLLHVLQQDLPERQRVREERPFRALLEQAKLPADTRQEWAVGRSISGAILRQALDFDLLVVGAPAARPGEKAGLGHVVSTILKQAIATVIVVKTAVPAELAIRAQLHNRALDRNLAPEALSLVVDKWFAENTFNAEEYSDLEQMLVLKRKRGITISLGLPTLNEEATIGSVITTLKTALLDDVPLLDEIVVIDSRSTDSTRQIAESLGIPVVFHQDVLPEAGPPLHGKGEALWKSLHALKGDIIAWVDTDVSNMHPRFVYGLLGPLLHEPRLAYVKGYYHRPIKVGDKLEHEGGGRVTELTVRPLFNLFFPMLSGFVQPLAGEYAGRREVLERLPFFSGYGVETGLLIDLLDRYGLSAIGQVNLGERIHRNQGLSNLSLMAFALVQVILSRLEEQARVSLIEDVNRSMKLIRFAPNQLSLELSYISDVERPPIHTIPAYRRARAMAAYQLQRLHYASLLEIRRHNA